MNYPIRKKEDVAKMMGASVSWIVKYAVKNGIKTTFRCNTGRPRPKDVRQRISATMKKHFRMERFRIMSGMKQKTRCHVVLRRFTHTQYKYRGKAYRMGYWYYIRANEASGERWNIYYNEETDRSAEFEEKLRSKGFNVLQEKSEKETINQEEEYDEEI